ncbi:3-deoxy-D-manno-octulosonic acid transferase, partial [Porphyromonas gulae]
YRIVLTFFSPSGYEVRKNYEGADVIVYLPADRLARVRKFLDLVKPEMAIFIKYDFWPCFLTELERRQIPTYLVSSIFRPSQLFFRWYGGAYKRLLHCFTHIFVQDEASRLLLEKHGIDHVSVAGDTRFDRVISVYEARKSLPLIERFAASVPEDGLVIVGGSSWPPDEEILVRYFNRNPKIKLILAPHEIDKEHLLQIISHIRRPFIRLSEATESDIARQDCLIVDSFGLLSSIYRYGQVAFIGGGFGKGIHNTPEAAVYGIPVIFGPRYEKFKEARELIDVGGGFSISSAEEFGSLIERLQTDKTYRDAASHAAADYIRSNAGATEYIVHRIMK